jgi:hypothetical protein
VGTGLLRVSAKLGGFLVAFCALVASAGAIEITTVDDSDGKTVTFILTGRIAADDAFRVRSFVNGVDSAKTMIAQLDFSGGTISEAMAVGRFFYQSGIRTVIPAKAKCNTPCPLVLVGGRDAATGRPSYVKYSSATLGFLGFSIVFDDKEYSAADLDNVVAGAQRSILAVADYLRDVEADANMLKYHLSTARTNQARFITNEQALDLGISIMSEQTGQLIEPRKRR